MIYLTDDDYYDDLFEDFITDTIDDISNGIIKEEWKETVCKLLMMQYKDFIDTYKEYVISLYEYMNSYKNSIMQSPFDVVYIEQYSGFLQSALRTDDTKFMRYVNKNILTDDKLKEYYDEAMKHENYGDKNIPMYSLEKLSDYWFISDFIYDNITCSEVKEYLESR